MKKRFLSVVLCLCMVMSMLPGLVQPASAATKGHTRAQALAWALAQVGEKLDYDLQWGPQCVDLLKFYYIYLGNGDYAKGNGKDYVNNVPPGWKRVYSNPQPGDVIVWGANLQVKNASGKSTWPSTKYGHVGIVVKVDGDTLTTVEQFGTDGNGCRRVTQLASCATCFIRPDFSDAPGVDPEALENPPFKLDPYYYLVNKATGKNLTIAGKSASTANAQVSAAANSKNQQFKVTQILNHWYTITPASNEKVRLNQYAYSPKNGTNVNVLTKAAGDETQGWWFVREGDTEYYSIRSSFNNNVALAVDSKGNAVLATYSKGNANQLWAVKTLDGKNASTLPIGAAVGIGSAIGAAAGIGSAIIDAAEQQAQPVSGKTYTITNKASGRAMDVYGPENSASKANVHIYDLGNYKTMRFTINQTSNGWYLIVPTSNTKLVVNAYSYTPQDGTNINVYGLTNNDSTQGWYFESAGNGYYVIRNAYNRNVVLTASGKGNQSNVKLATYNGSDYQLWKLTQV